MMRTPTRPAAGSHVLFEHFWVEAGPLPVLEEDGEGSGRGFVMTPSVEAHLRNLARAALIRRYPVLLQARRLTQRLGSVRGIVVPNRQMGWGACLRKLARAALIPCCIAMLQA